REFGQGLASPRPAEARVVDEDRHAPHLAGGLRHHVVDRRRVGHVAPRDAEVTAALRADLLADVLDGLGAPANADDVAPGFRQVERHLTPEAGPGAGDDGALTAQVELIQDAHWLPPWSNCSIPNQLPGRALPRRLSLTRGRRYRCWSRPPSTG